MDPLKEKRRDYARELLAELAAAPLRAGASPRRDSGATATTKGVPPLPPPGIEVIPTCCFSCNTACEVLVFRDSRTGKILKVEGDPDSPVTRGLACAKGLASVDLLYNPDRIKKPLRRRGPRNGEPDWEEIGWDEALDEIAARLLDYRGRLGAQSIAFLEGTRRGWSRVYSRLANAFGAPNHGAAGWAQCLWPRLVDCKVTFGAQYPESCDFPRSECILVWGSNPAATWPLQAAEIMDARERGATLIVVDPRLSETAAKADIWLKLLPGSDTDLALGFLNVILEEGLYDREFVENWSTGFEELRAHVADRSPEFTEELTRVPAELIRKAARLYATKKPACLSRCVSVDQTADSVQTCRALSLLIAVTGNVDVPGGNVLVSSRGELSQNTHDFILAKTVPREVQRLRRGYDRFPLLCGELSPVPSAHMPSLWETIATGEPYPIKAALIFGSNAAISYTNSGRIAEALGRLEFIAVADLFLTPTARYADIVLPASSWLERDNIISSFQTSLEHTVIQQSCATIGEARADVDIICDLARRLGLGELFWKDARALYDHLLSPTGLSFKEAARRRRLSAPLRYGVYKKSGFKTPSGKVELVSSLLAAAGSPALPPGSSPAGTDAEYPLTLTTGARCIFFRHTENRRNPWLLAQSPAPLVYLNEETAQRAGIRAGDLVEIETKTGRARLEAKPEAGIDSDIVEAVPGWEGEANINRALGWDRFAEGIGTVPMRGIPCRIKKVADGR